MDACIAVEREIDKVESKFQGISEHAALALLESINHFENLRTEFQNVPEDQCLTELQVNILKETLSKIKETTSRLAGEHRDLHSTVSRVGKAVDRNFVVDFSATSRDDAFSTEHKINLINNVVCQHLYRQGMVDVAEALAKDSGIDPEFHEKEAFIELNHILDSIKNKDLEPALAWAVAHREALETHKSCLEFKLHRLKYIEILTKGGNCQNEAINYARNYFRQFVNRHEKDIQTLMGMLLYVPTGFANSPYSNILNSELWIDMYELFAHDACHLLGVTENSPLAICINAGCSAVPALLNIKQVMMQRQVSDIWHGRDELPIEIDLGTKSRFHSMFACPILRQQSSQSNPPMRLVCGHVISRDALTKLCNGTKMKCPYCPLEQNASDARVVLF